MASSVSLYFCPFGCSSSSVLVTPVDDDGDDVLVAPVDDDADDDGCFVRASLGIKTRNML